MRDGGTGPAAAGSTSRLTAMAVRACARAVGKSAKEEGKRGDEEEEMGGLTASTLRR